MKKRDTIRDRVLAVLRHGGRFTGAGLAREVGHPYAAATVTAKVRDLRKQRHGGHKIKCWRWPEMEEPGKGYVYVYELEG